MKALSPFETLQAVALGLGKWCMRVSIPPDHPIVEVRKAAPWVTTAHILHGFLAEGGGILVFDSEAECRKAFDATVGDDGPTKTNPYDGPCKVFACTCGPDGKLRTENT